MANERELRIGDTLHHKRFELRWELPDASAWDAPTRRRILTTLANNLVGRNDGSHVKYALFSRPRSDDVGVVYRLGVIVHKEGNYDQRIGKKERHFNIGQIAPRMSTFDTGHQAHMDPYSKLEELVERGTCPPVAEAPAPPAPSAEVAAADATHAAAAAAPEPPTAAPAAADVPPALPFAAPATAAHFSFRITMSEIMHGIRHAVLGESASRGASAHAVAAAAAPAAVASAERPSAAADDGNESTGSAQSRPDSPTRSGQTPVSEPPAEPGLPSRGLVPLPSSARQARPPATSGPPAAARTQGSPERSVGAAGAAPMSTTPSARPAERAASEDTAPAADGVAEGAGGPSRSPPSPTSSGGAVAASKAKLQGAGCGDASSWRSKS